MSWKDQAPDFIESARSGHSKCRGCGNRIKLGEARFATSPPYDPEHSSPRYRYFHLKCAATAEPERLAPVLARWDGKVEDRKGLDTVVRAYQERHLPYAERAAATSPCASCEEPIGKQAWRVVTEEGGVHPVCARRNIQLSVLWEHSFLPKSEWEALLPELLGDDLI